jgi:hypothetical protein
LLQVVKRKNVQEEAGSQVRFGEMDANSLQVLSSGNEVGVFYRGACYATFSNDDKFSRNFILAQLHVSGGLKLKDLAAQFGLGYQQCSNIVVAFKESGVKGILDESDKKKGTRRIITEKIGKFIFELKDTGKTYAEISQAIRFRFKKRIKPGSIASWVYLGRKRRGASAEEGSQVEMLSEEVTPISSCTDAAKVNEVAEEGKVRESVWLSNVYAGAMVLYAMIAKSDVLNTFGKLQDDKTKGTAWDVKRVILTLFFLHALRCKSVEQGKHLVAGDFDELVGGDFLRLQWLRYAVDRIVEKEEFSAVMQEYCKQVVKETDDDSKIYYTDGHFSAYYGKRKVPKGYDPRRQMPMRGRNTIYLHNSLGENVFLFESPTNTTLSNDIETLVAGMEKLEIELKGKTLFFDRGGWSAKCFRFLRLRKMYFGTYLKNRKKERLVDEGLFVVSEVVADDGEVIRYKLFEKESRETRYGRMRVIVFLADDGRQIPVVSTNPYFSAGEIVYHLSRRWREENGFKYMIEHFGIDLLTTYKTQMAPDKEILQAHPGRKEINQLIAQKKNELEKLRAALAERIHKSAGDKTIGDFFAEESELAFAIKNAQVDLDILSRRRETIPPKQKMNLKAEHVIISQKRRLFVNTLKALNYNCEKWLQKIFNRFHAKQDEVLSLIRSVIRQPGEVRFSEDLVEVRLKPLASGTMATSLNKVLKSLQDNNDLRFVDGRKLAIAQTR